MLGVGRRVSRILRVCALCWLRVHDFRFCSPVSAAQLVAVCYSFACLYSFLFRCIWPSVQPTAGWSKWRVDYTSVRQLKIQKFVSVLFTCMIPGLSLTISRIAFSLSLRKTCSLHHKLPLSLSTCLFIQTVTAITIKRSDVGY